MEDTIVTQAEELTANTLEELDIQLGKLWEGKNILFVDDVKIEIFPDKEDGLEEYKQSLDEYLTLCREGKIKHLTRFPEFSEEIVNRHLEEIKKLM
jgi:hypothetical protein